jgi:hypothetical protein
MPGTPIASESFDCALSELAFLARKQIEFPSLLCGWPIQIIHGETFVTKALSKIGTPRATALPERRECSECGILQPNSYFIMHRNKCL